MQTFCNQDQVLLCIECVKNGHQNHDKVHITDLIFNLSERLNKEQQYLQETICLVELSKISQYEQDLLGMIRRLFKKVHEILYEMENKRSKQIDNMLFEKFGQRISIEESKQLQGIGQKLQENLERLIKADKFLYAAKEYHQKIESFINESNQLNTSSKRFLEAQESFNPQINKNVFQFDITELELKVGHLINGFINMNDVSQQFQLNDQIKRQIMKDPKNYELQKNFTIHNEEITCMIPLINGNMITGSLDSSLKEWNSINGQIKQVFDGHTHAITKIIELFDGNLASCSLDKTINVWERKSGEIINTLEGFDDLIQEIKEIDDQNIGILNENDKQLLLWKYRSELEDNLITLEGHQDHITSFMVASKKHIFTGGKDCLIKKWFPKESLTPLLTMNGHSQVITDLCFVDNKYFASASFDKTIKLWESNTGWCIQTFEGHTRPINKIIYISDMNVLVSGSIDQTIKVWQKDVKQALQTFENGSKVKNLFYLGYYMLPNKDTGQQYMSTTKSIIQQHSNQERGQINEDYLLSNGDDEDEEFKNFVHKRNSAHGGQRVSHEGKNISKHQFSKVSDINSVGTNSNKNILKENESQKSFTQQVQQKPLAQSQRKNKKIDDNNRSVSSIEDALEDYFNSPDEKDKVHIIGSLNHIKGYEAKINIWNINSGQLVKTLPTGQKQQITGLDRSSDLRIFSASRDCTVKAFF